jgi:hypothetical protein
VVWPHDPEQLQDFFGHLNSLMPAIQFTMETEPGGGIPFLDVLVIRKETALGTKVCRQSLTLNFSSDHHAKRGLIQSFHKRASTICQECQDLCNEISSFRHDLQLKCYPQGSIESVINKKGATVV